MELYLFVPYLAALAVAFYAACIFGAWRQPDAILESNRLQGGPYDSRGVIRDEFDVVWQLCGMVPLLRPVVRLLLNFALLMILALYHKVTLLQQSAREADRMSAGQHDDAEQDFGGLSGQRPHSPLHALVAPNNDAPHASQSDRGGVLSSAVGVSDDEIGPAANPLDSSSVSELTFVCLYIFMP